MTVASPRRISAILLLAATLGLSACEGNNIGTKQAVGTVGGAVLGGFLGSQIGGGSGQLWATGAGAVLGALAGSEIGKSLDRADRAYMGQTTQASLEHTRSGETSTWQNPDSGHTGSVTPTRTYQQNETYCREFQQSVTIGGETERAYGTACRQPDGTWKIQ
jgi:surface antigen